MANPPLITRLDARDRALLLRCAIGPATPPAALHCWTALTVLGGARGSVLAALAPALRPVTGRVLAVRALVALIVSHLVVQLVKRTVGRPRPSQRSGRCALVVEPDRFSFPSGHAAASMSVALAYASVWPGWFAPLVLVAALVGASRVCLGVHYPGDVLAGQTIAAATVAAVLAGW